MTPEHHQIHLERLREQRDRGGWIRFSEDDDAALDLLQPGANLINLLLPLFLTSYQLVLVVYC